MRNEQGYRALLLHPFECSPLGVPRHNRTREIARWSAIHAVHVLARLPKVKMMK